MQEINLIIIKKIKPNFYFLYLNPFVDKIKISSLMGPKFYMNNLS